VQATLDRAVGSLQAFEHRFPGGTLRHDDREANEATASWRCGISATAVPDVEAKMMVIAAGSDEERPGVGALGNLEPEQLDVEALGQFEAGNLEVHMSDPGRRWHVSPGIWTRLELAQEVAHVQGHGRHGHDLARRARPLFARPISIDLQPIPFRIGEVEGLTHTMIGRASQWPAIFDEMPENASQLHTGRQEDRCVVETRSTLRSGWSRRIPFEEEMRYRGIRRQNSQQAIAQGLDSIAEHASIETTDEFRVGDAQRHRPEPGARWQNEIRHC
jgi:hypothetical protein